MKNKNFTRFLCFFMCFCLCFAWFGPSIEAQAVAVELGWVTYVIISVMAAMGITATVSGGIYALKNAVEDGFDEWVGDQKQAKITQISDYISYYEPPNGDGLDPDDLVKKLLIGGGAFTVIKDFIDWLTSDGGWSEGFENTITSSVFLSSNNNGVDYFPIYLCNTELITSSTSWVHYNIIGSPTIVQEGIELSEGAYQIIYNPTGFYNQYVEMIYVSNWGGPTTDMWQISSGYDAAYQIYSFPEGYSISDIVGYSIVFRPSPSDYQFTPVIVFSDNTCLAPKNASWHSGFAEITSVSEAVSISVPSEITEFEVADTQQMELSFRGISGSFATPEEFSEAVKTTIVDTGVLPDVEPTVTEVTEPAPTPVPTPDVESDGTLEGNVSGILEWIKAIFNAILSLPQAIADLILDGIKAIFVPDPEILEAEFMDLLEEINDKYLFDFDLDSLFGSSKEPDDIAAVYAVGNHSWSLTFVSWYYLKQAVDFFRPYIRGFIVLMLIFYNLRQFMGIFGLGGVMNGDSADRRVNDLAV